LYFSQRKNDSFVTHEIMLWVKLTIIQGNYGCIVSHGQGNACNSQESGDALS
jgi:hypothetical protein